MLIRQELVRQAQHILLVDAAHKGGSYLLHTVGRTVGGAAAIVRIGIVEREKMLVANVVGKVGYTCEGITLELGERRHALSLIGILTILTRPTICTAERIHINSTFTG